MKLQKLIQKYHKEFIIDSKSNLSLIKRLLKYLKPHIFPLIIAILFLTIAKTIEAIAPVFIGKISQQIIDGASVNNESKNLLMEQVFIACLWITLLLFIGYFLDTISMIIKNLIGQKAIFKLRTEVFEHIQLLSLSYFDHTPVGRLITRTIHDVDQINQMFAESIVPIFGSIILFFGMMINLTFLDWRVALAFGFLLPFIIYHTHQFTQFQRHCYDLIRNIVSAMNTFFQERLLGSSTIRNFGLQKIDNRKFKELNHDHYTANLKTIENFSHFIAGIDLLQNFSLILIFVVLVLTAPKGVPFQAGVFFTFSMYTLMIFRPLADLAERYNVLQSAISASERIFSVLDEKIENQGNHKNLVLTEIKSISFEDVWFAYENTHWVLKGVSFEIKQGETLGIIGITGSGKTSIFNLLLRFYPIQKGTIKINGREINDYSLEQLRHQFSLTLQEPILFSGSLAENISLFQPQFTHQYIEGVLQHLGLIDFINRFPKRLSYMLGDQGQGLSIGEMQLISLIRAVTHNRSVFLLDEATANIDSNTEALIQKALRKILHEKTSLVIAHRLSTIKDVNKILVLHEGEVVEMGTHTELLEEKGLYEKLYRIQFQ